MRHLLLCTALAIVPVLNALPVYCADENSDPVAAEKEEADREEAILEAQGKIPAMGHEKVLQGKYLMTPNRQDQRADIPGVFVVSRRVYQVKLGAEDLRKRLASFHAKKVTLGGKIRNRGTYFIVDEVLTQPGGHFLPAQTHTAPGRL